MYKIVFNDCIVFHCMDIAHVRMWRIHFSLNRYKLSFQDRKELCHVFLYPDCHVVGSGRLGENMFFVFVFVSVFTFWGWIEAPPNYSSQYTGPWLSHRGRLHGFVNWFYAWRSAQLIFQKFSNYNSAFSSQTIVDPQFQKEDSLFEAELQEQFPLFLLCWIFQCFIGSICNFHFVGKNEVNLPK